MALDRLGAHFREDLKTEGQLRRITLPRTSENMVIPAAPGFRASPFPRWGVDHFVGPFSLLQPGAVSE